MVQWSLQEIFRSPISLNIEEMNKLCHTVLFQGHLHNCCPECFLSFSLAHTCRMTGNALIIFGLCFCMVCDFATMTPFRLHFCAAFALFVNTVSFFKKKISRFAEPVQREYICAYLGQKPYNYLITVLCHFEIQTCHF